MKIVVKHFADPEETISAIPGKVTVQVTIPEEAGGEDVQGPIDLTLGQQLTLEVAASEFEYPGGGIEGCFPAISDTQIQAVLDPAPPAAGAMCNGRCIGSPNFGVTVPDKDCPVHGHLPSQVAQGRQAHPDWAAEMLGNEPVGDVSTPVRLYPQTAREALLEIRRRAAEVSAAGAFAEPETGSYSEGIDRVALEGLARTEPINFELTDQLADRLAEAHSLMQRWLDGSPGPLSTEVTVALALPPDLETMVERRRR